MNDLSETSQKFITLVYKNISPNIYRFGRRFTNDSDLIKDCIHDTFYKLCTEVDIEKIQNMNSFVFILFRNTLIDELKREKSTESINNEIQYDYKVEPSTEERLIEIEDLQEINAIIEEAFNCLTLREKEIISLYFMEQQTYEKITELLNITKSTAKNTVHNALKKIRENFKGKKAISS